MKHPDLGNLYQPSVLAREPQHVIDRACPYGQTSDRLWVRETFAEGIHQMAGINHYAYAADLFGQQQRTGDRWRPSIHMPRKASRITLEITGVRVERLQDISEADAIAEGIERTDDFFGCPCWKVYGESEGANVVAPNDPIGSYRSLWESINIPGSWDTNPLVWVVEFHPIDAAISAADSR